MLLDKIDASVVFVTCMPKAATLRYCEVSGKVRQCVNTNIGDMRLAFARLNNRKLEDTVAQYTCGGICSDDDDLTSLGDDRGCALVRFNHLEGGIDCMKRIHDKQQPSQTSGNLAS
jgi:hypothetical protein